MLFRSRERLRREGKLKDVALAEGQRALRAAGNKTSPMATWLANRPTPGGIGTLLAVILVFLMAIVPVDNQGNTRLKLLWLTLTGKTSFNYVGQVGSTITGNQQQSAQVPQPPAAQPLNVNIPPGVDLLGNIFGT